MVYFDLPHYQLDKLFLPFFLSLYNTQNDRRHFTFVLYVFTLCSVNINILVMPFCFSSVTWTSVCILIQLFFLKMHAFKCFSHHFERFYRAQFVHVTHDVMCLLPWHYNILIWKFIIKFIENRCHWRPQRSRFIFLNFITWWLLTDVLALKTYLGQWYWAYLKLEFDSKMKPSNTSDRIIT